MAGSRKKDPELQLYAKRDGTVGIRNMPKFHSQRQEADWWAHHGGKITDFAMAHGLPGKRPARGTARAISLRLPEQDLERARRLAEYKGLGYQTYMKMLLHEALGREEKKLGRRTT
jgi:predicted DNA binding CopG/RHH family protein